MKKSTEKVPATESVEKVLMSLKTPNEGRRENQYGTMLTVVEREKLMEAALSSHPNAHIKAIKEMLDVGLTELNLTGISAPMLAKYAKGRKLSDGMTRIVPNSTHLPHAVKEKRDRLVRDMLRKNPSLSFDKCKDALQKDGLTIGTNTFYAMKNKDVVEVLKQPEPKKAAKQVLVDTTGMDIVFMRGGHQLFVMKGAAE